VASRLRTALGVHRPPSGVELAGFAAREREDWRAIVRACLGERAAGGPCFEALFAFYATAAAWEILPDAVEALEHARASGLRTAVASNMDHRLPALLSALELAPRLDAIVIPSICGLAKPDARFFLAACRSVGATPEQALYVGDRDPDCVEAARATGLRALRYDPDARDTGTLHGWSALAEQLARGAEPADARPPR
jgi:HAD superfamily hydrolase (TIGR01509 family)